MAKRTCSVDNCDRPTRCKGMCQKHYQEVRRGQVRITCSIDGCVRPADSARGWCGAHYRRWHKYGDAEGAPAPRPERVCSIDGCTSKVKTHGWCGKHYERWRTTGTTADPVKTTYEDRFWSYVDKTKDCWNWTRAKSKAGYGIFTIERRQKPAHRLSYKFTRGPIPDGMQIDHICHNRACVNPEHLRLATNKQNMENPAGLRVDNTSGHQGVTWDRSCGKWKANVHHNGRNVSAGRYASKEAAAQAVARKRCELFTHNDADREARLNVDAS